MRISDWSSDVCSSDLAEFFRAADRGQVTLAEAKLLLQTVLSAGADTTYLTMANALRAWAEFPSEYAKLRADPKKLRSAFDESLRWDAPSRMARSEERRVGKE